jgi:hypothetical protein
VSIATLRMTYHRNLCAQILSIEKGTPNIADSSSTLSSAIARRLVAMLPYPLAAKAPSGQTAGVIFERLTRDFLEEAFQIIQHLRPGRWRFSTQASIVHFEQYEHLADLQRILHERPDLKAALGGDYLITPDIVVARHPVTDSEINQMSAVIAEQDDVSTLTPLRAANRHSGTLLLHASISCKWTMRSDRAQNIRTEGLNLVRNRKGHTPHIVAVTAEPLPSRLASLALGTGDLDCVYHFALPELRTAVEQIGGPDQTEIITAMIEGRRLRDISDLPFDLAA